MILRHFVEADLSHLVDLDSDPEVMKYLSDGRPSTVEEKREWLVATLGYYQRYNNQLGVFPATLKDSGEFIGWFILRPDKKHLDNVKDVELGYRLQKKFWGQGFASEISSLLLKKAFQELNVETVFAKAMTANHASINVMKKMGMKFQKDYVEDLFPGADKSAKIYIISKFEWESMPRGDA